jgi:hypothetical protein
MLYLLIRLTILCIALEMWSFKLRGVEGVTYKGNTTLGKTNYVL